MCIRDRDFTRAAAVLESAGDFKAAGKYMMDAKEYEAALELYERCSYEVGQARALERLERYGDALAIWKRRGSKRDAARLEAKLRQSVEADEQGDLFG